MNKKLKSVLCGAMAFVAGSVVLSACGAKTKTEEPTQQEEQQQQETTIETKTTISLVKAKEVIVNALAIDNKLSPQADDTTDTGNRDIMEKMGRFTLNEYALHTDVDKDEKFIEVNSNGFATYQDYQFFTLLMDSEETEFFMSNETSYRKEYFIDGNYYYQYNENSVSYEENYTIGEQYAALTALFKDESFANIYDNNVTKELNKNGYSLTLQGDLRNYMYYYFIFSGMPVDKFDDYWLPYEKQMQERYAQDVLDGCHLKVTVNFDNDDEIIGVVADISAPSPYPESDGGYNVLTTVVYTLSKTDAAIKEPEWVTAYKTANAE